MFNKSLSKNTVITLTSVYKILKILIYRFYQKKFCLMRLLLFLKHFKKAYLTKKLKNFVLKKKVINKTIEKYS